MAKQRRDTLPYEQERTIRNFLGSCDFTRLHIPGKMRGELISMLGYKTAPNGALVWKSIECKWRLGQNHSNDWPDTFESDWETLCEERKEHATVEGICTDEEVATADFDSTVDAESTDVDAVSTTDTRASEPTEGN